MNEWEDVYRRKEFYIDTLEPAGLVRELNEGLPENSMVLDLGCGNGRNSLFLAANEHTVDAVDIADLDILRDAPDEVAERIRFFKESATDFEIREEKYEAIMIMRLIQYLPIEEVGSLLKSAFSGLKSGGALRIAYTFDGELFDGQVLNVSVHKHSVEEVRRLLEEAGFTNIEIDEIDGHSTHTPMVSPGKFADIKATKPE